MWVGRTQYHPTLALFPSEGALPLSLGDCCADAVSLSSKGGEGEGFADVDIVNQTQWQRSEGERGDHRQLAV